MLNKAIISSSTDYLIFIDGDCVLHTNFIEEHLRLKENNVVLCGRRTEPGEYYSNLLRTKKLSNNEFYNSYFKNYFQLKKDNIKHYEDGIYCKSTSLLGLFATNKGNRKEAHLVGCNWSCHKNNLLQINGFDEDFQLPTTGEDTDIERRLKHFGVRMKSCRNFAIMLHLYHKKNFNSDIASKTLKLMNTKIDQFICKNGINKYE
jgi:GT2 family glycosyltransferase